MMNNVMMALIPTFAAFVIGTAACCVIFILERMFIFGMLLKWIHGEKEELAAIIILHIVIFVIGFGMLFSMYKVGV